ncbi:unnamed protein product [Leptosia nina]|uniref:Chitin-binding type-2 domain-containing protein n=1 Tax=Leptosia nina TaxID=320188 RepID=A0AAV1JHE6_9NEOP
MRFLVIVACVCAVAYAQIESDDSLIPKEEFAVEESVDGIENTDFSSLRESSDVGAASQDNVANVQESSDASDDVSNVRASSDTEGDRQAKYLAADQYEEQSAPRPLSSKTCIEKNERYSIPGSCDKYIECLNGTAEEKVCPDGLRYNPDVKFNVYPCQYPIDVPCLGRSALQPAQATADCPHQFGYFKVGDSKNCGTFKNCVNGVAYEFNCPEGLAFSSETYRCEWPDLVPDCDVEAFLGFRCPEVRVSKELGPPAGYRFYRSSDDCQKYFICIDGRPRRLACGGYTAFDDLSESCVAADEISACPLELRNRAELSRKAESQRLTAENAFGNRRNNVEEATTYSPYNGVVVQNLQEDDAEVQNQDIDNNGELEQPEI